MTNPTSPTNPSPTKYSQPQADSTMHKAAFNEAVFDTELIKKYNRSGPRYTSYPTALEFVDIGAGEEAHILAGRDAAAPISLYTHIPFCRHVCYYCACNKIITKKNADSGNYLKVLEKEIAHKAQILQRSKVENGEQHVGENGAGHACEVHVGKVEQVHLGGGTPTFLTDSELGELWGMYHEHFDFADGQTGDYSIEIDPRELRETTLGALRDLGFSRISFGVQDLEEAVQIAVNRVQPESLVRGVMHEARALGYGSINIDLIYGLPHQSPVSFARTLERIIELSPDRLSVFNYAHLPARFAPQKRIKETDLPAPEDKLAMLKSAITMLGAAGYQYIGMDHFAKPDDTLAVAQRAGKLHRNFQGYTTHGACDLLGFGVSSISHIGDDILQNSTDLNTYTQTVQVGELPAVRRIHVNLEDKLRRHVIMQLLCHNRMDFKDINNRYSIDPINFFAAELEVLADMQADKLVDIDPMGVTILPRGRLLARNVAMVFDTYLAHKNQNRFSKVI